MTFVGARLRLGRTYRGETLRELATAVASTAGSLSRIERDQLEPSELLVDALALTLDFDRAFFYRPVRAEAVFTEKECSFRKRTTTPQKVKERILSHGTLLADLVAEVRKQVKLPAPNIPRFPNCWSLEAVDEAAESARVAWGFGEGPIDNMIRVLEHAGVIVVRLTDDSDLIDAFSRPGPVPFVIMNDAKGSASRARADLAHELGHLVLHAGTTGPNEEVQAERFGSAFLLPAGAFGRRFGRYGGKRPSDWNHIWDLKQHWKVSAAMIVRRAYDLGLVDAIEYRQRFKHLRFKGWHKGEPLEPAGERPELLAAAVRMLISKKDSLGELIRRLGWTPETLRVLAGMEVPSGNDNSDVLPFTRARLSLS